MSEPRIGGPPAFRVDDTAKMQIVAELLPAIMQSLDSDGQGPTGDDILDTLCLAIAVMLEHDTHVVTPRHMKLALQTIETFIRRRHKGLAAGRTERGGLSMLEKIRIALARAESAGQA